MTRGSDETSADYADLITEIETYSDYIKVQKSVYLVESSYSAKEIRDQLEEHVDANDRLLVIGITQTAAWKNPICTNSRLKTFIES